MKYDSKTHHRKSIRLKSYDYSQAGLYFITICIQNRECLFGDIVDDEMVLNDAGGMIKIQWLGLTKRFANIQLHEFIIMPNHFHGIIEIVGAPLVGALAADTKITGQPQSGQPQSGQPQSGQPQGIAPTVGHTVGDIVGAFKSITTHEYIGGVKTKNWQRFNRKLWQRNYWEHIVRNEQEYYRIAGYINNNPAKWHDDKLNNGLDNCVMQISGDYQVEAWMV